MRDYQKGDVVTCIKEDEYSNHLKLGTDYIVKRGPEWNKILLEETKDYDWKTFRFRPKYWYVKRTDDPRWKRVIDYCNAGGNYRFDSYKYVGYDGVSTHNGFHGISVSARFENNAIELTIDEWINFGYDKDIYKEEITPPKELTVDDFKVGDVVTISSRPTVWGSGAGGEYPLENKLTYPFTGTINRKKDINSDYVAIDVSGWGFSLTHLLKEKVIIKSTSQPMEQVTITRKQLLQLYDEIHCSTVRTIIDGYLNSRPRAYDDFSFVLEQKHLDRIKELNSEQKKILGGYIKLPEPEVTYELGQWFDVANDRCLLAQVDNGKVCLISVKSGNRLVNPLEVMDTRFITKSEVQKMAAKPVRPIQVVYNALT